MSTPWIAGDAEGDEESGAEDGDGVDAEEAIDDGPLGAFASGDERRQEGEDIGIDGE